ncbi:MAG: hypothetical protein LBM77_08245 [Spirochaetaceae bacterium]|jgi:hypothetical protein|nr:hypothetical protein [Spirochaetaceae bacterium]
MKKLEYGLNSISVDKLFSPIQSRNDVILVMLEIVRLITYGINVPKNKASGKMLLRIDKMNRIFLFSKNKYYSMLFPFSLITNKNQNIVYGINNATFDNEIIALLLRFFKKDSLSSLDNALELALLLDEENDSFCDEKTVWRLVHTLLSFEPGYLRYDNDQKNVKSIHPASHLDINFTNTGKIKIGLENTISNKDFIDIVNTQTIPWELKK